MGEDINTFNVGTYTSTSNGTSADFTMTFTAVPEPHEYALVSGIGLVGFAMWRRRSRVVQAAIAAA